MKKRICSIVALVLLALMLLSACGQVTPPPAEETANGVASNLDAVAPYAQGIAGSVANGTILDWVYQTVPGSSLPAESAYKTMSTVSTGTFSASNGYNTTNTFYSLSATDTTYFSLTGCKNPAQNSNQYYRLNFADSAKYPGSLNTSTLKGSGVAYLATQTAGVAIRFCTNASMVAIDAVMQNCNTNFNHMPFKGVFGFDVYVGTGSNRTWVTNTNTQMVNEGTDGSKMTCYLNLPEGYKEVLINFPQYGGVKSVNIGLPKDAKIAAPPKRSADPILIYGSSITQGACSGRPGTSFTNILSRMLDADLVNLGFSGSGCGEVVIQQYICNELKSKKFSVLVLDYASNPTLAQLLAADWDFYNRIREVAPNIPIVMLTRPLYHETPATWQLEKISVVASTYQRAVGKGDQNIFMLPSYEYFTPGMADIYTVDGSHPNDLGHLFMANKIYPYLYECMYGDSSKLPKPDLAAFAGWNGKHYALPDGGFDGAKIANAEWHAGFVAATKQSNTAQYDATTNAYIAKDAKSGTVKSLYSYTDMMHFPKAGTKVWYHIPASTYAKTASSHKNDGSAGIALVAFYDSNGAFINGKSIKGTGTGIEVDTTKTSKNNPTYLYDSNGNMYFYQTQLKEGTTDSAGNGRWVCYITQTDNERIRFSYNLYDQASAPTIYYCEPEGPAFYPANKDTTKVKVDVNWNMNKSMQWDLGMIDQTTYPAITSDVITIPKAGTTIVWWDDTMPDPGIGISSDKKTVTHFDAFRTYSGGMVGIAAFKSDGNGGWTYDPGTLRILANNQQAYGTWPILSSANGGKNVYADTTDGTMRCYAYTTTKDNETIRISYYAGWDYEVKQDATTGTYSDDTSKIFKVRPYDVYMYVPNN